MATSKITPRLSKALMFAGLIPFVLGTICVVLDLNSWWIFNDIKLGFAAYCIAIASFMSGIHWGLAQLEKAPAQLLVHSNLMVLLPWVILLTLGVSYLLFVCLAYVFMKQFLIDRELLKKSVYQPWYVRARLIISVSVCVLMLVSAVFTY